jgi:hypothetical protein
MDFTKFTRRDAEALFNGRRTAHAEEAKKFHDGDHYQDSNGYIGDVPPRDDPAFADKMAAIEAAFQSVNVVSEVTERHVTGATSKEPGWGIVPITPRQRRSSLTPRPAPQPEPELNPPPPPADPDAPDLSALLETDQDLTVWWDEGEALEVLKEMLRVTLREERVVAHLYIPRGARGVDGNVPQQAVLRDALKLIHVETLTQDVAGVFIDPDTERPYGVYLYEREIAGADGATVKEQLMELSYLDEAGNTIVRVVKGDGTEVFSNATAPYQLGGLLTIFEMRRAALITPQVLQNQKALNLDLTQMVFNINLAGSRERTFFNVMPPGRMVYDEREGKEVFQPAPFYASARVTNFLQGAPVTDEEGHIIGKANPTVNVTEPVNTSYFTDTQQAVYALILEQVYQLHVILSRSAVASGQSRIEARADFAASLTTSKTSLDKAGRWLLTAVLRFAAQLAGQPGQFANVRVEFDTIIYAGPLAPDERTALLAEYKAGVRSLESTMILLGEDDPAAEMVRIEQEGKRFNPGSEVELEQQRVGLERSRLNLALDRQNGNTETQ